MARHKEGIVETYFVEQVEKRGGLCRKACWVGRRGCPDRWWAFYGKRNGFVEIKAPGCRPEPHQEREIKRLKTAGVPVYVIDSLEAVDDFIRREA